MAWIRDYKTLTLETNSTDPSALVEYPTHQTNDLLLLMMAVDGTAIPALPTGYTNLFATAGVAQAYRLCYKIAASAAETCPTLSLSVTNEWHIGVFTIAGIDYADPINFSAERSTTDAAQPFTWTSSASTDENNVLIFQFINSDFGLGLMCTTAGYTNIVNEDSSAVGFSAAYTFQETLGSIIDATWKARADDDTTACAVGFNDDGNGTRPGYGSSSSSGNYLRALGQLTESDTNPASFTLGAIGMRDVTKCFSFDGTSTYTDETTDINDTGTADVTLTNATGAIWYFGYGYIFSNILLNVSTAQSGGTIVWEYYNGSTWSTLTVAGVLTATGWVRITWTPPSDWAVTSVNSSSNYYWVRMRVTATFTATPVLTNGHIGGWLTLYDAPQTNTDAGFFPYIDSTLLTPTVTLDFCGEERQFGAAIDMSSGILLLHHKAVLPKDYAGDSPFNDVTYPVTNIGRTGISGSLSAYGGVIVVLADANNNYEAYSIHCRNALSNSVNDYNIAAIALNSGAMPYASIGTLNKAAVTRIMFLPQSAVGSSQAHISTLVLMTKIVVAGGDSANPITMDDLVFIANNSIGVKGAMWGIGDFQRVYVPLQIGGGGQVYTGVDGGIFQFPTTYDGKRYFDYNGNDNVLGITFYGTSASDTLSFTNCVFKGSQPYAWGFNASHSASAVLDFSGSTVKGATVTLQSTSDLSGVKFQSCPTFTQNGASLDSCEFIDTKITCGAPANAALITNSTFTSSGTGHAMEITGTAANITLTGLTFTGYSGTSTNAPIYVNIASGTMTISIVGGGSVPTVRTAGATVTVQSPVTVGVTVKALSTLAAIQSARVLIKADTGGDLPAAESVTITRSGTTASVSHTAHGMASGQSVLISGATQDEYNGIFTISNVTTNAYDYTVSGTPATPATGTITSTAVILSGTTNASGVLETTTFNFTANQPITGTVRRASSGVYYKAGSIVGTITSSGFSSTVLLIGDT